MKTVAWGLWVFACVTAGLSVLTAAWVAHQPGLSDAALRSLQWAVQMQQVHALALLWLSWWALREGHHTWRLMASTFMALGIVFFSINIEAQQLLSITLFKAWTPWGGVSLVLGWLVLAAMPLANIQRTKLTRTEPHD